MVIFIFMILGLFISPLKGMDKGKAEDITAYGVLPTNPLSNTINDHVALDIPSETAGVYSSVPGPSNQRPELVSSAQRPYFVPQLPLKNDDISPRSEGSSLTLSFPPRTVSHKDIIKLRNSVQKKKHESLTRRLESLDPHIRTPRQIYMTPRNSTAHKDSQSVTLRRSAVLASQRNGQLDSQSNKPEPTYEDFLEMLKALQNDAEVAYAEADEECKSRSWSAEQKKEFGKGAGQGGLAVLIAAKALTDYIRGLTDIVTLSASGGAAVTIFLNACQGFYNAFTNQPGEKKRIIAGHMKGALLERIQMMEENLRQTPQTPLQSFRSISPISRRNSPGPVFNQDNRTST
jgi:hypothetical protein